MNGDVGKDMGEDAFKGDVGVPKLDGKDKFESDVTNEFVLTESIFEVSGVHSTVGRDILSELLLVDVASSISGGSAMFLLIKLW